MFDLDSKYAMFQILVNRSLNTLSEMNNFDVDSIHVVNVEQNKPNRAKVSYVFGTEEDRDHAEIVFHAHGLTTIRFKDVLGCGIDVEMKLPGNGRSAFLLSDVTDPVLCTFFHNLLQIYEAEHGYTPDDDETLVDRYCVFRKRERIRPNDNPAVSQNTLVKLLPVKRA